jgi:anti-sigma-K factor RskA
MNNREFIESGVLETYALGMCTEEEARRVEAICSEDPAVRAELDQIQEAINSYAASHSKTPNAETREKILAEIAALEEPEEITRPTLSFYNNRLSVAASLIVLSLSLLANIVLYNKWKAANNEVIALNSEKQQLADNLRTNEVKYETMSKDMAIMGDPDMTKVMMKGMEKSPESMAMIYWNKKSKEVFVGLNKLPMPEKGKQYQLWAIVDGKPVDAGMITMTEGDSSLHRMKDFETAQAFAITLEPEGGVTSPTMSEMYVMGTTGI